MITEELKSLAAGQEIIMNVDIDENMYHDVCLELMVTNVKGESFPFFPNYV